MNGERLSINDAAAFVAAIDKELEDTTREGVELTRKGRQTPSEADYVTGLIRDIRSDLVHAFGPLDVGTNMERANAAVSWRDKARWINRELELRTADYPEWVRKGRMTQADARTRIKIVATLRRLYWCQAFMWDPEPGPALDYMTALRTRAPIDLEAHAAGREAMREQLRRHVAAVELEDAEQGRLVG